jgi:hypothetical protein
MDKETEQRIRERAYVLWENDGRPEGGAEAYWLQAEAEIMNQPIAGGEDPQAALDDQEPGAFPANPTSARPPTGRA